MEDVIYSKGYPALTGAQMSKSYITSLLRVLEALSYSNQATLSAIFRGSILPNSHPEIEKFILSDPGSPGFKRGTIDDVIDLFSRPEIYQDGLNVVLTLKLILNVVSESFRSQEGSKESDSELVLSRENIIKLCMLLNNKYIKSEAFTLLTEIISRLCFNEQNLGSFIEELTKTIFNLSCNLN